MSRLMPNPDIVCWSTEHYPSAFLAVLGLVIWCFGIPVTLALRVLRLQDRQSPENYRPPFFLRGGGGLGCRV